MSVIEFAEHRLAEEERQHELGADNRYDLHYWAAYLDGARAQKKKNEQEIGFLKQMQIELSNDLPHEVLGRMVEQARKAVRR